RSRHPFRSCHRYARPTLGSGRHSFCRRRVRSHQTTTPDPQSVPSTGPQSTLCRPSGCRFVCSPHSPHPLDPFSNRTEAFDSLEPPPNSEESKVSPALLTTTKAEVRSKGTVPSTDTTRC